MNRTLLGVILILLGGWFGSRLHSMKPTPSTATAAVENPLDSGPWETALFGAGCFWGVEAKFSELKGVTRTRTGYAGGHTEQPTYEEVCSHTTGHAEVVEVRYDPTVITFDRLLDVFWAMHDPTVPRKFGPEEGGQYRSAIFCTTPEQVATAQTSARALEKSGKWPRPVATEIAEGKTFWPAEEYHQHYYAKQGMAASCRLP